jgi:deoxyribonuclease V
MDRPTIGCAKSLLCGNYDEPGETRGSSTPLVHAGDLVGAAVRTRDRTRVVYVSIGHRVSLETAKEIVLACSRTRIPEPTRLADRASKGLPLQP